MIQQITKGIKISVDSTFEGTFYKNSKIHFAFGYRISIENQSKDSVQLLSRYWKIKDALNHTETVQGDGVIGEKPIIKSGQIHTYKSGCLLSSPFGSMIGYYTMINFSSAQNFKVLIPEFKLSADFALN